MSDLDFFSDFSRAMGAISTNMIRPNPKIGRDTIAVKGGYLTVSTVETCDCGHETAIIDKMGTHPVQRYKNKEDALKGHDSWVKKLKGNFKVIKLGYGHSVKDKEIILKPFRSKRT